VEWKSLKSSDIRETFIRFFEERNHRVVPSSSLVPNDPTLLLTNAGMVQFKPYFLGEEQPPYTRATSVQKCLRTTDIDSVGITARHNTFFEMLGNFSFGDYYKESVIPWAWELVTEILGIDAGALWISVYEEDDEAESIWKATPGVRADRVIKLGADDNFWDMGSTGPCGPCSEILFDRGEQLACGPGCTAGCDCDRFLELWNLVFMQYDRWGDQSLDPLPKKNIDTGMGLERVAALKQGVSTIFETDLIAPVVEAIGSLSGVKLGDAAGTDISIKVVSDHSRAATFLISDGVIPSNEGRGYILRRLLRRAVRHGRLLEIEGPFIAGLADVVVELMGDVYPGIKEHHRLVTGVISSEEERFGQTLEQGIELLKEVIDDHRAAGKKSIEGKTVFYLHDTLGFPLELTEEIASDEDMKIERDGFERLMEEQRERARLSREYETQSGADVFDELSREWGGSRFEGYTCAGLASKVTALLVGLDRVEEASDQAEVEVVLEGTPFYAESGGQVGDTGSIKGPSGVIQVEDTYYGAPGLIVHRGRLTGTVKVGDDVEAEVDTARRLAISRNHSATHLLHWALRQVLGTHAKQSGSLVTPERLRFDFTHFQALTEQELEEIEKLANARVLDDVPVSTAVTSREEATSSGAIALFGEKYGEQVRVVQVGDFSKELCGGIHVERSGSIGPIRIISESGIGAGLRRIEASCGFETLRHYRHLEEQLEQVEEILRVKGDLVPQRVSEIQARVKELERTRTREKSGEMSELAEEISGGASIVHFEDAGGFEAMLARRDDVDPKVIRDLTDMLMSKGKYGAVGLAGASGSKAQLVIKVDKRLVSAGVDAREIARAAGKHLGGGGGGRADMAVAGGSRVEGLDDSLVEVESALRRELNEGSG
jgi:alanyl-tRNA synthetase